METIKSKQKKKQYEFMPMPINRTCCSFGKKKKTINLLIFLSFYKKYAFSNALFF